jgi:hypothetical protein
MSKLSATGRGGKGMSGWSSWQSGFCGDESGAIGASDFTRRLDELEANPAVVTGGESTPRHRCGSEVSRRAQMTAIKATFGPNMAKPDREPAQMRRLLDTNVLLDIVFDGCRGRAKGHSSSTQLNAGMPLDIWQVTP